MSDPDLTSLRAEILEYVQAAYFHGLAVENFDTGELELPKDISDVGWIADHLADKVTAYIEERERLARFATIDEVYKLAPNTVFVDWKPNDAYQFFARLKAYEKQLQHQSNKRG